MMLGFFDVKKRTTPHQANFPKLKDSFTDNPREVLFNHYRSLDNRDGTFNDGTTGTPNIFTFLDFPKHFHAKKFELHELKGKMKAELKNVKDEGGKVNEAEKAV